MSTKKLSEIIVVNTEEILSSLYQYSGSIWEYDKSFWILAKVVTSISYNVEFSMINLYDGNRWSDPLTATTFIKVHKDFVFILHHLPFDEGSKLLYG